MFCVNLFVITEASKLPQISNKTSQRIGVILYAYNMLDATAYTFLLEFKLSNFAD